nr:hypothetical protein [Tanacetum cinerariifolium]
MFLVYDGNFDADLQVKCYCDAGFETDRDDTKSQTGYVFTLNGGAVVWKSSKQSTTAQHAAEAEYIAAAEAAKESVWIRKFVDELGPGIMKGARHFQRKFHYVRECVETGEIKMVKVHTDDNLADPFTKALAGPKLTRHARSMGLRPAKEESRNIDLEKELKKKIKRRESCNDLKESDERILSSKRAHTDDVKPGEDKLGEH